MWPRCPRRSRAGRTAAGGRGPRAAPAPEQTPPPHPAGAPTSQQAVKRVGHAKVKREAPVKTKVLEPARESRGSHGSLGATSGSTEPREGAGPCGWRRRPRPRRSAGPREASPSAWPPLALAVLPNPAHGSGTVPSPARTCVVCCLLMTSSLSPSAAWCARSLLHSALQEKATDLLHLHNV